MDRSPRQNKTGCHTASRGFVVPSNDRAIGDCWEWAFRKSSSCCVQRYGTPSFHPQNRPKNGRRGNCCSLELTNVRKAGRIRGYSIPPTQPPTLHSMPASAQNLSPFAQEDVEPIPKRTMIRYARDKEQNEGREIAPISVLENHIEKHNPLKRTEMPSVAEWDSIYNKSLEMISVRFFSPSLMGIESENCSRSSLGNERCNRIWRCSPRSSQRSKPC